jgi:iron complex outermembrane receptor protein
MIKQLTILIFFFCIASSMTFAKVNQSSEQSTEQEQSNIKDVLVQPKIVVTEKSPYVPAPLQDQAQQVMQWSGSASFNSAEYWQEQRAANIKDILDFIPGVFAQQRNGAESARISIRGSGLGRQFQGGGLLLLQDGIPLNSADGSFDFQSIDPWLIDYVSVYRGGNGIALGGSTLGGVIQLGSTQPNQKEDDFIRLSGGSFGTQRGMVSYTSGGASNFLRIRASHFNQDGFRVQNQQRSNRIDLQYFSGGDSRFDHRVGIYHLNTQAELPSSLSKSLIEQNPRGSRGFNIFGNFNRDLTLTRLSYQLSDENLSATFFIASKKLDNPVFTYINRDSDDAGINLAWQRGAHRIQFNTIWGEQHELRRENEGGFPGEKRLFREQNARTTTAGYHYQLPLLRKNNSTILNVDFGIQAIYAQRDIDESFPELINSNRSYSQINPRIALSYRPQINVQWFTSLTRSFEAPTFSELNNGNQPGINAGMKAQSADTFEIGGSGFTQRLVWDISLYYSQIDNEFIRFRFPDGATRTTNAKQSIHWGLEGLLRWQIADNLLTNSDQLSITNSYQNNQFRLDNNDEFTNNKIPGIPEHYFQSRLEYKHPSGWQIIPSIEWVPSAYYIDLANTVKTDNYLLTGLSIIYKHSDKLQWYFDAKNLNNQTYISTTLPIPDAGGSDGNYFYSGEGRGFTTGLRWSFN